MNSNDKDPFKKMSLDFSSSKEKEITEEKSEEIKIQNHNVNTSINNNNTIPFVEFEKNKKSKTMKPKLEARWRLIKIMGWIFVIILSIIFGMFAIFRFFGDSDSAFLGFIHQVRLDDTDNSLATKYFFTAVGYSFEAGLFIFFILYSVKMSIKNYIPYLAWRKETAPKRIENKISKVKISYENAKTIALSIGIKIKHYSYDGLTQSKELKKRKENLKKLKNKISKSQEKTRKKINSKK